MRRPIALRRAMPAESADTHRLDQLGGRRTSAIPALTDPRAAFGVGAAPVSDVRGAPANCAMRVGEVRS
jgi:hypothetical protein